MSLPWRAPAIVCRIHQAKDILIRQIDNPPSLLSLARQVGINDFKLKQGFRQVFGTTVFGYLHSHRMERAAQLLQGNHIWSQEIRLQSPENVRQLRLLLLLIKPPVIIFQNDIVSQFSTTTITIPLTTNMRRASLPICVMIKRGDGGLFKCFALL